MKTRLAIAGGVLLIGSVFAAEMAAAQPATLADADRRRGCRRAGREGPVALLPLRRHQCAHRWGWGDYGYRRCLWRHGC